jgi:hypothetical protein
MTARRGWAVAAPPPRLLHGEKCTRITHHPPPGPSTTPTAQPIQAVDGIVGQAEMWGALLSMAAFLIYMPAADGRYSTPSTPSTAAVKSAKPRAATGSGSDGGAALTHWLVVGAALALALLAALAKEIGITVAGTMMLYDLMMSRTAYSSPSPDGGPGAAGAAAPSRRREQRRRFARVLAALATGVFYVKLRGWVAGDHLVRIYRKVRGLAAVCPACCGTTVGGMLSLDESHVTPHPTCPPAHTSTNQPKQPTSLKTRSPFRTPPRPASCPPSTSTRATPAY